MRRIRHFGDFVNVPLAIVIFVDLAGMYRLYLILLGRPPWRDRTTFWPHRTSILNRGGVITPRYARAEFFLLARMCERYRRAFPSGGQQSLL